MILLIKPFSRIIKWNNDRKINYQQRTKLSKELTNLYKDTLHRKPDRKGFTHYMSLLLHGKLDLDDVRYEIENSQEYFERIVLGKDKIPKTLLKQSKNFVKNTYKQILGRNPHGHELEYNALLIASGHCTEEDIKTKLMNDPEYFQRILHYRF